jgi:hypothetical protein
VRRETRSAGKASWRARPGSATRRSWRRSWPTGSHRPPPRARWRRSYHVGARAGRSRRCTDPRAAEQRGHQGTPAWTLIEGWLERRPGAELRPAWEAYVAALREKLPPAEFANLREDIVERAREVARAAGGFLGIASVSADEKRMIEELEKALR